MLKQTVLITGASSGIGYELSKLFAREGNDVILVARSHEKLEAVAGELKGNATVIPADLAAPEAAQALYKKLLETERRVDVLVNNAGFGSVGPFVETKLEDEQQMIQVNITALVTLSRLFLPGMLLRKSGGILNVASTASFQPGPYMATYYATKAFVLSFSHAIAEEAARENVTVTALCPGPTLTQFQQRAGVQYSPLFSSRLMKVMSAADVAQAGYDGFRAGKRVIVPGFRNKVTSFGTRLFPTWLAGKLAGKINQNKQRSA
jgi:short-subunit dehydrogenase